MLVHDRVIDLVVAKAVLCATPSSARNITITPGSSGITLSGLGNVILGIFNSQKHLPHRESKVTQILKECLSSVTCQATMLAHVSPDSCHYSETLHTVQLAARLHKLRRKRLKSSSSEERKRMRGKR